MAAAIKAINARIRANPVLDYFCSTRESYPDCATSTTSLCDMQYLASAHEAKVGVEDAIADLVRDVQISGAQRPTSASPSPQSWTRRRILTCTSPPLPSLFARPANLAVCVVYPAA
jgi:hypothetical protein